MNPLRFTIPGTKGRRRRPVQRERGLHRAVAEYLALALPPDCAWTTFPAGSGGKARGGQLKAAGLRPGWPDIQVLHRGRFLGIELKSVTGRLSPAQQLCMEAILRAGGVWAEARSVEDVQRILVAFGVPLRGKVMT
mgnify:CR=1 FL=1